MHSAMGDADTVSFVGKVFSRDPDSLDPRDARDQKFRFTHSERRDVDLVDLPVMLEHSHEDENHTVGRIASQFYDPSGDGTKWVIGEVDTKDLEGKYATEAMRNGLYSGLSRSHFRDNKEPIEVSLTRDPRRRWCDIIYSTYKGGRRNLVTASKMADTTEAAPTTTQSDAAAQPVGEGAPAGESMDTTPDATEVHELPDQRALAKELIRKHKEGENLRKQLEDMRTASEAEIKQLREEKNAILEEHAKKNAAQSEALMSAVQQQMSEILGESYQGEHAKAIKDLETMQPDIQNRVLRLIDCASSRFRLRENSLLNKMHDTEHRQLANSVHEIYNASNRNAGRTGVKRERDEEAAPARSAKQTNVDMRMDPLIMECAAVMSSGGDAFQKEVAWQTSRKAAPEY